MLLPNHRDSCHGATRRRLDPLRHWPDRPARAGPSGEVTLTAAPRRSYGRLWCEGDLMAASLSYPRAVASNSVSSGT